MKVVAIVALALMAFGCTSGTAVVTGTQRAAISPDAVKVYGKMPDGAEVVAMLKATSDVRWTDQGASNRCIAQLKREAAKLGANGIVIAGTGEVSRGSTGTVAFGTVYVSEDKDQMVTAQAIWVP